MLTFANPMLLILTEHSLVILLQKYDVAHFYEYPHWSFKHAETVFFVESVPKEFCCFAKYFTGPYAYFELTFQWLFLPVSLLKLSAIV